MSRELTVAVQQDVFTLELEGVPAGLITGFPDGDRFIVRHVAVFPGHSGQLIPLVREGLSRAKTLGYASLAFGLPATFHRTPKLRVLAAYLGFEEYTEPDEQGTRYYMRWVT